MLLKRLSAAPQKVRDTAAPTAPEKPPVIQQQQPLSSCNSGYAHAISDAVRMLSIISFGLALSAQPGNTATAIVHEAPTTAVAQARAPASGYVREPNVAKLLEAGLKSDAFKAIQVSSQPLVDELSTTDGNQPPKAKETLTFDRLKISVFNPKAGFVRAAFKSNDPDPENLRQFGLQGMDVCKTWMIALTVEACDQSPALADNIAVRWDGFTKAPARFLGRMYLTCGQSRDLQSKHGAQISQSQRVSVDRGDRIDDFKVQLVEFRDASKKIAWQTELKRLKLGAVGQMQPNSELSH